MRRLFLAFIVAGLSSSALADDMRPQIEEASGNWISLDYVDGLSVKVCVAVSIDKRMAFRADEKQVEFRSTNDSWSLSADASGDATIKIGTTTLTVPMVTLNSTTLAGAVKPEALRPVFDAMDKSPTATISFNGKKPISVSLNGSTRVLNSFRTCSASQGFGDLGSSAGPNASPF